MTKKQNKAKKATRSRRRAQAAPRPLPQPTVVDKGHMDQLCGLTDPFCPAARSARYPDAGAGRTMNDSQRLLVSVDSLATGDLLVVFGCKRNNLVLQAASITTGTATMAAAAAGGGTGLMINYGGQWRLLTAGVRIMNTLSATDSSGTISLAKGRPVAVSATTDIAPAKYASFETHSLKHGGEWKLILNPTGGGAYDWIDKTGYNSATDPFNDQWDVGYIYASGLPTSATGCLTLEFFFNYEFKFAEDDSIAMLASPQPVFNAHLITAVNHVQSSHQGHGTSATVKSALTKLAKQAFTKHVLPHIAKRAAKFVERRAVGALTDGIVEVD